MKRPESFTKESSQIAKGVAILWLLFYHLFSEEKDVVSLGVNYAPMGHDMFYMLAAFGKISVAVFVIVTAYGISSEIFKNIEMTAMEAYKKAFKRFFKLMCGFGVMYISIIVTMGYKFDLWGLYGELPQGLLRLVTDGLGFAQSLDTPTLNITWWYMDLAYQLIFLVPLVAFGAKKIGYGIIPVAFFLPIIFTVSYTDHLYLFSAVMGVAAAYGDWFNKLLNIKLSGILKWCIGLIGLAAAIVIRYNPTVQQSYVSQSDSIIGIFIIWFSAELLTQIPVVREFLCFVGKNSLNIFMVHSFFFLILYRDFVYGFKAAGLIYLVLLGLSLGYSVILEAVKKWIVTGYGKIKRKA